VRFLDANVKLSNLWLIRGAYGINMIDPQERVNSTRCDWLQGFLAFGE
tara:strand:- start:51 stop:194 length:144 start_codon:yes stop_codon:yes gene_type:complete